MGALNEHSARPPAAATPTPRRRGSLIHEQRSDLAGVVKVAVVVAIPTERAAAPGVPAAAFGQSVDRAIFACYEVGAKADAVGAQRRGPAVIEVAHANRDPRDPDIVRRRILCENQFYASISQRTSDFVASCRACVDALANNVSGEALEPIIRNAEREGVFVG